MSPDNQTTVENAIIEAELQAARVSGSRSGEGVRIDDLIGSHPPGCTLDRDFYTHPEIFERDLERIYRRRWLFAGHISRIPNAGDFFIFNVGGESIIVIRDEDGSVHALLNVCRHRGSRICQQPEGQVKKLVCPYHAWVYNLDGSLSAARLMPADFDRSQHGLHRAHVRVFEGLIFVSLAQVPERFDPLAQDIGPFLKPYRLDATKICCRKTYDLAANWKVVAENSWECYHCGPAHPELATVMSYVAAFDSTRKAAEREKYIAEWVEYSKSLGHMTGGVPMDPGGWYRCDRLPIRPGFVTQSQDGRPVAPVLGNLTTHDGGVLGVMMYPLIWFAITSDHAMLMRCTPVAPIRTEVEITWLVHQDAVEGVDYDVDRVTWLWKMTGEQDWWLCENNQAGINSRFYKPGSYAPLEVSAQEFVDWYLKEIA